MTDPKAIARIIAERPGDIDLSTHIAQQLANVDTTRKLIAQILAEDERERARHEEALRETDRRLAEARKGCPHYSRTRYADPSGGSDSCTICNICGAEL
jgi:hypothetical protein